MRRMNGELQMYTKMFTLRFESTTLAVELARITNLTKCTFAVSSVTLFIYPLYICLPLIIYMHLVNFFDEAVSCDTPWPFVDPPVHITNPPKRKKRKESKIALISHINLFYQGNFVFYLFWFVFVEINCDGCEMIWYCLHFTHLYELTIFLSQ